MLTVSAHCGHNPLCTRHQWSPWQPLTTNQPACKYTTLPLTTLPLQLGRTLHQVGLAENGGEAPLVQIVPHIFEAGSVFGEGIVVIKFQLGLKGMLTLIQLHLAT